jgi:DNA-binding transcriptional regulator YiaG
MSPQRRYARRHSGRQSGDTEDVTSVSLRPLRSYGDRMDTPTPNSTLRSIRMGLLMSQDEFARALRDAGLRAGQPNDANKRLVQRWESGTTAAPRPVYARALETVTGLPIGSLGFAASVQARVSDDGRGGHDLEPTSAGVASPRGGKTAQPAPQGNYSGVWLSRYEYYSSGRDATFTGRHYVVVLQHGNRLTVRSLPGSSDSPLSMDLTIDGNVITGTWVEQTAREGYYRGARYHGVIQILVEPTGRRMAGKWVGFGREMDVNSGPWELVFQDASTNKATLARYDRLPE